MLESVLATFFLGALSWPVSPVFVERQEPWPFTELKRRLTQLDEDLGDLMSLEVAGVSRGGRDILVARLTAPGTPEDLEARRGLLLVANVHGPSVFTGRLAYEHLRELGGAFEEDENVRRFLEQTVLYVIPRANPDAAEARCVQPLQEVVSTGYGVDNDRDGRRGEDPPQDVDGDGQVTWIRVEDPEGRWKEEAADTRVLVKADPARGERGRWKLWPEGRDLDGDGAIAEDDALDARVDRNFPAGWKQFEDVAGRFPTDEPEALALCEWVVNHPQIAAVVTYGRLDNLVKAPKAVDDDAPAVKRIPPSGILSSDGEYWKELGKRYRDLTGNKAEGDPTDDGSFQRWCYEHRGLWSFAICPWDLPTEVPDGQDENGKPQGESPAADSEATPPQRQGAMDSGEKGTQPSREARALKWIDSQGASEQWRFVNWRPFEHPDLGSVEIGGFAPFAKVEPPEEAMKGIEEKHREFLIQLGDSLARLRIAECTRTDLGGGIWRVKAILENEGRLPLLSKSAQRTHTVRPARIDLELSGDAELLGGKHQVLVEDLGASGGRRELLWLVRDPAEGDIEVTVETDHAGRDRKVAEVAP